MMWFTKKKKKEVCKFSILPYTLELGLSESFLLVQILIDGISNE